eukprot:13937080-Ditylum_brightwellii.AAC.1
MATGIDSTTKMEVIKIAKGKYSRCITDGPMVSPMENTIQAEVAPTRSKTTRIMPLSLTGWEAAQGDLNDGQGGQMKEKIVIRRII